jgi:hypothetical protein
MAIAAIPNPIPFLKAHKERSEEVALWECAEDSCRDGRKDEGAEDGLEEDGVLDLSESWLLDPDFAVEDLADEIALLVFGHPWLVFPAVARVLGCMTLERIGLHVDTIGLVLGREQLPWSEMTVVHTVENLCYLVMFRR